MLPGKRGKSTNAVFAKLAMIAALPAATVVAVIVLTFVAVLAAVAGQPSAAATCNSTDASQAAPISLDGPPANLIPIYQAASTAFGLNPDGPAILAGINRVETDFGTNMNTSSAGAIGWMQFMPETWAEYGNGGNPYNAHDAIFAAARYLKANGAPKDWYHAIFAYNHAGWYVDEVERYARQYASDVSVGQNDGTGQNGGTVAAQEPQPISSCDPGAEEGSPPPVPGEKAELLGNGLVAPPISVPPAVQAMIRAGNKIAALPYVWAGHHALGSPTNGYDCSSAVSYVMFPARLLPPSTAGFSHGDFYTDFVAASFVPGGSVGGLQPGKGKWVTIYTLANSTEVFHVFMEIAGVIFNDSSSEERNGKGPGGSNVSMWQPPMSVVGATASHPAGL